MTLLLPTIISGTDTLKCPLLLIQYDLSQSPFSLLKHIVRESSSLVLLRAVYPASVFTDAAGDRVLDVGIFDSMSDWMSGECANPKDRCIAAITSAPPGPLTVLIDSLDSIAEDMASPSFAAQLVRDILSALKSRASPTRLIIPLLTPSPTASQLRSFNPRIELRLHVPALLHHIEHDLLTPPSNPRFWTLLVPLSARCEGQKLVQCTPNVHGEVAVEIVCPSRRGVLRTIEMWHDGRTRPVESQGKPLPAEESHDNQIIGGLSFNLTLTEEQQSARSRVALPYAHTSQSQPAQSGDIIYDPDSADDFDEEDPDDDLDL